jgi:hypothetical protein
MTKAVELSSVERICRISSIEIIENYFPRPVQNKWAVDEDSTLNIFSFLDTKTLVSKIPLVCRYLCIVSQQNEAWNGRLIGIPQKILNMSVSDKEKYKMYHYDQKKEVIDLVLTHRRLKVPLYFNFINDRHYHAKKIVWKKLFSEQLILALRTDEIVSRKVKRIIRYFIGFRTPKDYDHFSFFTCFATGDQLFDPKVRAKCIEMALKLGKNPNQRLGFSNHSKRYQMDFEDQNPNRFRDSTLLHRIACDALYEPCYVQTLKTCLEYGANVNAVDEEGLTPLQYTQQHANTVFQQYLQSLVVFQCEKQRMIRSFQTVIQLLNDSRIRGSANTPHIRRVYF